METVFNTANEKMEKSLNALKHDYSAIRAGRANTNVLDKVMVDYYGTPTPINQVAAISIAEARILVIQPWDSSLLQIIEKAIQTSDIGINPNNDGKVIRLMFPQLTEDRRKEIVKEISKRAEEGRVSIRAVRRDCIDKLKKMKKNSEITEDDLKDGEAKLQKITDKFIKKVDDTLASKEKEILEI